MGWFGHWWSDPGGRDGGRDGGRSKLSHGFSVNCLLFAGGRGSEEWRFCAANFESRFRNINAMRREKIKEGNFADPIVTLQLFQYTY